MKYLCSLVVVFTSIAFSQSSRELSTDTIYLQQDSVLCARIVSADSFAVYLSDGKIVGLKVIDSLSTSKRGIVAQFLAVFPAIGIRTSAEGSTLFFGDLDLPTHRSIPSKLFRQFSSLLYYFRNDDRANLEMQFSFLLTEPGHLVVQIGASTSLTPKGEDDALYRQSMMGTYYHQISVFQAFFGIGLTQAISDYHATVMLNVGEKNIEDSDRGRQSGILVFISPSIERSIFDDHVSVSIGSHIFLNKFTQKIESAAATFNVGLGYRL